MPSRVSDFDDLNRIGVGTDRASLLDQQRRQIPLRPIILAIFLFIVGTVLLILAGCITTGIVNADYWWPGQHWSSLAIAFFVIGSLSFVPGAYSSWIAFASYRGYPGYSFDQIPSVQ